MLFPVLPDQLHGSLRLQCGQEATRGSRTVQIPSEIPFYWTAGALKGLTCKAAFTERDVELVQHESVFSGSICWSYLGTISKLHDCLRWCITAGGINRLGSNLKRESWRMGSPYGLWKPWYIPANLEGPCVGLSSYSGDIWDGPDYCSHSWLRVRFCWSDRWRPREYCRAPAHRDPVTRRF